MNSASQSNSPGASPALEGVFDDPTQLVGELERLARAGRGRAVGASFPLLCGASATLASIGVIDLAGEEGVRWYWAIVGPAIGAACALYYATRRVQPPDRTSRLAVAWALLLLFGMLAGVTLASDAAVDFVPAFFVAALLVGLGALYRHTVTMITGAAGFVIAVTVAAAAPPMPDRYTWTALCFGVVGAIGGIVSMLSVER